VSECLGKIKPGMGAREAEKVSETHTQMGEGVDGMGRIFVAIRTGGRSGL